MQDIKFGCTLCGQCCHNHSLPLTLDEAIEWLQDHGNVGIFCEAHPWTTEPPLSDLRAQFRRKRSFGVVCGSTRMRVIPILVGIVSGACKNLGQDLKCQIYDTRPLVCRIYPAEISPFIQLNIARKACPPEAWQAGDTLLAEGNLVDLNLRSLVEKSRQTDRDDVPQKLQLCRDLNLDVAAVADEGWVTYEPDSQLLLASLRKVRAASVHARKEDRHWTLYSPDEETNLKLTAQGFEMLPEKRVGDGYMYIHAPAAAAS